MKSNISKSVSLLCVSVLALGQSWTVGKYMRSWGGMNNKGSLLCRCEHCKTVSVCPSVCLSGASLDWQTPTLWFSCSDLCPQLLFPLTSEQMLALLFLGYGALWLSGLFLFLFFSPCVVLFCFFVWRLGITMSYKEMERKWWREKEALPLHCAAGGGGWDQEPLNVGCPSQ